MSVITKESEMKTESVVRKIETKKRRGGIQRRWCVCPPRDVHRLGLHPSKIN